jgi:hypothetical protein
VSRFGPSVGEPGYLPYNGEDMFDRTAPVIEEPGK